MGLPAEGVSAAVRSSVLVERFELELVGADGVGRRESLSGCWMEPFETVLPVRRFGSFRGKRSFSGLWAFGTTGEHVGYESWLERDHVMALDFDVAVAGLASQPFRLGWRHNGKTRTHVPDYFARLRDGTGVVIDVRAEDRIDPEDAEAFEATAQACVSVGWTFRRIGEIEPVLGANLRWLAGYRHPRCLHVGRATDLRRVFAEARPLMEGARRIGDPIGVLPTLYHLLWRQVLATDLRVAPLSAASLVHTNGVQR